MESRMAKERLTPVSEFGEIRTAAKKIGALVARKAKRKPRTVKRMAGK